MKTFLLLGALSLMSFIDKPNLNSAKMIASRNAVIHSKLNTVKNYINVDSYQFVNFTFTGGQWTPGTTVCRSANNLYSLVYQSDGNLVLANNTGTAYWASGPQVSNPSNVNFSLDGNIIEYKANFSTAYWNANIAFSGPQPYGPFYWILQNDGNFVRFPGHYGDPIAPGTHVVSTGTGGPVRSSHFNTIR